MLIFYVRKIYSLWFFSRYFDLFQSLTTFMLHIKILFA